MSMNGTDDLGRFRLFGLWLGADHLVAESPVIGCSRRPLASSPALSQLTCLRHSTLADATPVRLDAGQEIADLEIRLIQRPDVHDKRHRGNVSGPADYAPVRPS